MFAMGKKIALPAGTVHERLPTAPNVPARNHTCPDWPTPQKLPSGSRMGFEASGCANVNEGAIQWRLRDAAGQVLAAGMAQASCGTGCVGDYRLVVDFPPGGAEPGNATLELYSVSMRDGAEENLTAVPLTLD